MQRNIVIRDAWGRAMAHCSGPTGTGACPRVDAGEVVPCAGQVIAPDQPGAWVPYHVASDEVTCPVTVARALVASPDPVLVH